MRDTLLSLLSSAIEWLTGKLLVLLSAVVLAVILYGAVAEARLLWLLLFFVGARAAYLIAQMVRKAPTSAERQIFYLSLLSRFGGLSADARTAAARELKLRESATPQELASAVVAAEQSKWAGRRSRVEQAIECAGLLAYCLVLPATLALYANEIVSLRLVLDWRGPAVVLAGVAIYWLPFVISRKGAKLRIYWWGLPLIPATILMISGVQFRHPYLNPFNPDRVALAAERVVALRDGILAGRHYDWVSTYARLLDARGDGAGAARYYRKSLRLNPNQRDVLERLAVLSPESGDGRQSAGTASASWSPHDRYWAEGQPITPLTRCVLDNSMESIRSTTIAIVRAGDVGDSLVDATGDVLKRELGVPVCAVPRAMPLPPHTRVRGLLVGQQWSVQSLIRGFAEYATPLPRAPVRFVLLTSADIFNGEANFVFAVSYLNWGAIVSTARFGDPVGQQRVLAYRVAKQALASVMKSFGVPTSSDVNSVTSYARSVDEHDAKGDRPNAEAMSIFQKNLHQLDAEWSAHRGATSARE